MRAVIKEETKQKIGARLYLTGSSGTGKSAFIHYLVWNILQNEPETWCVYNPRAGDGRAEMFYKKRIYLCFDMKECVKILSRLWNKQEGQGYLIYDSMMPVDLGVLPPEAVRQILVSSYGLELENADVRKWRRSRCWEFVMPAWRKRDVTEMTKLCYPNNALEAMEKYYQLWEESPVYSSM
jgi:Cdc6-like AAA superfamily ATPase